jgi:hypothetical protein
VKGVAVLLLIVVAAVVVWLVLGFAPGVQL